MRRLFRRRPAVRVSQVIDLQPDDKLVVIVKEPTWSPCQLNELREVLEGQFGRSVVVLPPVELVAVRDVRGLTITDERHFARLVGRAIAKSRAIGRFA